MTMTRTIGLLAVLGIVVLGAPVIAEDANPAALATALQDAQATLEAGLTASEREGKPISAKFEIEDGKLQLSVYAAKGDGFVEVVLEIGRAHV